MRNHSLMQTALGGIQRLVSLENAVNLLVAPEAVRREFFGHERLVATILGRISVLLDESITGLEVRESGPAPLLTRRSSAVFEHVYESYPERGTGVYGVVPL